MRDRPSRSVPCSYLLLVRMCVVARFHTHTTRNSPPKVVARSQRCSRQKTLPARSEFECVIAGQPFDPHESSCIEELEHHLWVIRHQGVPFVPATISTALTGEDVDIPNQDVRVRSLHLCEQNQVAPFVLPAPLAPPFRVASTRCRHIEEQDPTGSQCSSD